MLKRPKINWLQIKYPEIQNINRHTNEEKMKPREELNTYTNRLNQRTNIKTESEQEMNDIMIAYLISRPIYVCLFVLFKYMYFLGECMGITSIDIQITISNMHQENIVITLISIVFLTHANKTKSQRNKTHSLYTFPSISFHTNRTSLERFSFSFFHHLHPKPYAMPYTRNVKYFTSSCNLRRNKTVVLWQCCKLLSFVCVRVAFLFI